MVKQSIFRDVQYQISISDAYSDNTFSELADTDNRFDAADTGYRSDSFSEIYEIT